MRSALKLTEAFYSEGSNDCDFQITRPISPKDCRRI